MENRSLNTVIEKSKILAPLANCLDLLAQDICTAEETAIEGLFGAVVALLPLSLCCDSQNGKSGSGRATARFQEVQRLIERHLDDPEFTLRSLSGLMNMSDRSIQKYFSSTGTTFSSYLTFRRLERVRADLQSSERRQSIADVAFRWGFVDLSTFNRSFKRRFGLTPRQCRI